MTRMRDADLGGVALLGAVWLGAVAAAAAGLVSLSLVDQVVLLGVAVVLPLAIGGPAGWWAAAAAAATGAFLAPRGWAALLVVPFAATAGAVLAGRLRTAGDPRRWELGDLAAVVAPGYALVAAGALAQSRGGVEALGLREPIVELTAVHYTFAGAAALALAARTLGEAKAGRAAVALTAAAPPVVAAGFVTGAALPQVGGAVLMTLGVWTTATLQLRRAVVGRRDRGPAVLLAVSGLAVWLPMVLAVAWACGQHWRVPALSVPDMARTHGLANALAFTLCGLVGRAARAPGAGIRCAREQESTRRTPPWRWSATSTAYRPGST